MYIPHFVYPFIHSSVSGHLDCFHLLVMWKCCYEHWCTNICSSPCYQFFGLYLDMELLDHMIILCLIFWGNHIPSCIAVVSFYIFTSNAQGFQFPHIFTNTWCFLFLIIAILMGVKWCSLIFFASIFLRDISL